MDVTRVAGSASAEPAPEAAGADSAAAHVFADGLVCSQNSPLIEIRRTCVRVAASPATVLLTGETGTGKEVFARIIHGHSPRSKRQFVPVNCGAIPEALLESELFGYVKGAFTGANTPRRGRVALAEGGTLFLDEIGELPLALQVKLLRLLQARTYEPVGSSESVSADFRLVAATNRDLLAEVRGGRFRQDLYYRLNVCPVHLPPLRARRGDVAALFLNFWRSRGETRPMEPGVLERLESYDWPGNVRELENLVERLSVIAEGPVIRVVDLPPPFGDLAPSGALLDIDLPVAVPARPAAIPAATPSPAPLLPTGAAAVSSAIAGALAGPPPETAAVPVADLAPAVAGAIPAELASPEDSEVRIINAAAAAVDALGSAAAALEAVGVQALPVNLPVLLRELEEAYIAKALQQSGGNKKEAARLLGMGRTTLVEKLRRRSAETSSS